MVVAQELHNGCRPSQMVGILKEPSSTPSVDSASNTLQQGFLAAAAAKNYEAVIMRLTVLSSATLVCPRLLLGSCPHEAAPSSPPSCCSLHEKHFTSAALRYPCPGKKSTKPEVHPGSLSMIPKQRFPRSLSCEGEPDL
jgi:hypothetical protein